jgi:hypothetical protein
MNIIVEPILKNFYPDLVKRTIDLYCAHVCSSLLLIDSKDIHDVYKNYDSLITKIKTKYNEIYTQKLKFSSCTALIKCLKTKNNYDEIFLAQQAYKIEIDNIKAKIREHLQTGEKSERQKNTWVEEYEIKAIDTYLLSQVPEDKDIVDIKSLSKLRNLVIFRFYQNMASRNDIVDAKFYYDDEIEVDKLSKEWNYIILNKTDKTINYILNKYKTIKKHGSYTEQLEGNLYELFVRYKDHLDNLSNEKWFLLNEYGRKLSSNVLSILYTNLGNCINKKLSIRTNRAICVSGTIDIEQIKKNARKMGHTPYEALHTYAKNRN